MKKWRTLFFSLNLGWFQELVLPISTNRMNYELFSATAKLEYQKSFSFLPNLLEYSLLVPKAWCQVIITVWRHKLLKKSQAIWRVSYFQSQRKITINSENKISWILNLLTLSATDYIHRRGCKELSRRAHQSTELWGIIIYYYWLSL